MSRTEYFDVFFLGKSEQGVIVHGFNTVIPWHDFLPAQKISQNSSLMLPNLTYKKYLPPRSKAQLTDFEQLGLEPAELS